MNSDDSPFQKPVENGCCPLEIISPIPGHKWNWNGQDDSRDTEVTHRFAETTEGRARGETFSFSTRAT